ncbi:MAG TPA: S1 RNA-binding domain-containing protein [Polyangiaceae bacterium]|nr:S1 RNA-binding domain-containing protein [Polyangiaceae bacterium]
MSSTEPTSESSLGAEPEGSATPPPRDQATPSHAPLEPTPAATDTPHAGATSSDASSAPETISASSPSEASERTPDDAGETNAEASSGDETSGDETDDADTEDGETEGAEGATPPTADAQAAGGAPKKRRRRRKKKGGAGADASGAPQGDRPAQGDRPQGGKQSDRPRRDRTRHRASDRAPFHVGEEVFGKVTAVLDTAIMVDLSGKALAIFDRTEMEADDLVPTQSDKFVARIHNDGARGGLVVLTRKPLREEETKPKLEQAFKDGALVLGLITGAIKGGVEVDIGGVRAFAPASGMDLHPANANFTALVGQQMDFKVTQFDKAGRDVVVTRRPMLEAEAHERRKHALGLLQAGQVTPGVVRTVVEWGVFVALPEAENVEGLVHVSEATHDPQANLFEHFKHGDRFDVKILEIDDRGKIWLSRKALVEDPWGVARKQYAPGSRHKGKVVKLERFGAFVELESGIDGLLHISDLSFDRIEHPKDVLSEGQELEVVVNYFDARSKKIGLHLAPPPEQAGEAAQRVSKNALVKVAVMKGESAGLIVRILGATGRAARGFVPAGQTGTPRGTDLRKAFKVGTVLDTKVVEVDPRSGEPKLSIRGFKEDEERRAHREYQNKLKAEGGFGTLGDLLRSKLAKASAEPVATPPVESDETARQ